MPIIPTGWNMMFDPPNQLAAGNTEAPRCLRPTRWEPPLWDGLPGNPSPVARNMDRFWRWNMRIYQHLAHVQMGQVMSGHIFRDEWLVLRNHTVKTYVKHMLIINISICPVCKMRRLQYLAIWWFKERCGAHALDHGFTMFLQRVPHTSSSQHSLLF